MSVGLPNFLLISLLVVILRLGFKNKAARIALVSLNLPSSSLSGNNGFKYLTGGLGSPKFCTAVKKASFT